MATTHAILSPSSAHRWLTCTPSARFEEQIPDQDSEYAKEGTLAHELAAILLMRKAKMFSSDENFAKRMLTVGNDPMYSQDMFDHCESYADFVMGQGGEILVERGYSLEAFVPMGYGTADATNRHPDTIYVTDFKYGAGVRVTATANPQLMLYALGALVAAEAKGLKIERVMLVIFQPRAGGQSVWETSATDLLLWANSIVKPQAALAIAGMGDFVAGDHCRFCKAKTSCRAYYNLFAGIRGAYDSREITPAQRHEVLTFGPLVANFIEEVQKRALAQLIANEPVEGFKLVEGRGKRAFINEDYVVESLLGSGLNGNQIFNQSLRSLTDIEKALGKKRFTELLGDCVHKTAGGPTLAPDDDPRPAYAGAGADEYTQADINELV